MTGIYEARVQKILDQESDEDLIARITQGDRAAYAMVVMRHSNRFLALADRLLKNRSQAEDVIQEVFFKLWQNADKFNPEAGKFTTWFYRVVSNKCFDEKRKKKLVALPENFDLIDESKSAIDVLGDQDRRKTIDAALFGLPVRQRLAITLCYFEELSNKEAAEIMDVNIKALESLLTRARTTLRNTLDRKIGEAR